jgi:hypothetical protein
MGLGIVPRSRSLTAKTTLFERSSLVYHALGIVLDIHQLQEGIMASLTVTP